MIRCAPLPLKPTVAIGSSLMEFPTQNLYKCNIV